MPTISVPTLPSDLDPFRAEHLHDPFPLYAQLRDLGPVAYSAERDVWFVFSYGSVSEVLRNYRQFVSGLGSSYVRAEVSGFKFPFIDNDPPDHDRIRRSVQRRFSKNAVNELKPSIRSDVSEVGSAALAQGEVDIVQAFSRPLPDRAIEAVTGIQSPGPDTMAAWAESVFHVTGPECPPEQLQLTLESLQWLEKTGLSTMPTQCLGSLMMNEGGDGGLLEKLGTERLYALASIWLAGVDTTNTLISNMINAFALYPEQWDKVRADRSLVPAAVEEALRWDSPVRVFMRRTVEPVDFHGVNIPANADIVACFPSANRDPDAFERPDDFDVTLSRPRKHIAFGASIHLCLGAPIARLEAVELLDWLADRVERFEHTGGAERTVSRVVHNFKTLPIRFHLAAQA